MSPALSPVPMPPSLPEPTSPRGVARATCPAAVRGVVALLLAGAAADLREAAECLTAEVRPKEPDEPTFRPAD
jgi:hypothetical protein